MESLLPLEIKLEIFSRLPTESVLQCRQVCKTWRIILQHPQFADMHLQRSIQPDKLGFIYLHGQHYGHDKELYYGEYDENDEQSYKTLKRINHPPLNILDHVVGSCNGLILFLESKSKDDGYHIGINDPIVICNPITREYVNLPSYTIDFTRTDRAFILPVEYGFGYLPSTNEYKVVRILFSEDRNEPDQELSVGSIQVYTLGSGSGWRDKGEIWGNFAVYSCIHANGALYWLDYAEMKIMAFDLAEEKFISLPSPPFQNDMFSLRFVGGFLCIVDNKYGKGINLWSLKKKKSCTTYDLKEQEYTWYWHKECRIAWEGLAGKGMAWEGLAGDGLGWEVLNVCRYEPFALTKNGDVLMWYDRNIPSTHRRSILFHYDSKTATLKKLDKEMLFLEAIPHKNSLVSLKALGEEDVKILPDQVRQHL